MRSTSYATQDPGHIDDEHGSLNARPATRTAVIGVGYLGRFHAQKYAQTAAVEAGRGCRCECRCCSQGGAELGVPGGAATIARFSTPSTPSVSPCRRRCITRIGRALLEHGIRCADRKAHRDDGRRSARARRPRASAHAARCRSVISSVSIPRSSPPPARLQAAALRRVAPAGAVQAARHRRERRARPDDPRHRPDPGAGRRADREHRRRRRQRVLRRDRHRQCAHPLPGRLRRQHDGEPDQHEAGAQAPHLPGRRLSVDRSAAEDPDRDPQEGRGAGRVARAGVDRGRFVRSGRCAAGGDRGVSERSSRRHCRRSSAAKTVCARSRRRCRSPVSCSSRRRNRL